MNGGVAVPALHTSIIIEKVAINNVTTVEGLLDKGSCTGLGIFKIATYYRACHNGWPCNRSCSLLSHGLTLIGHAITISLSLIICHPKWDTLYALERLNCHL